MKNKKISSKLSLNKKTVANLGKDQQEMVKGGISGWVCPASYWCASEEATCTCFTYIAQCHYDTDCPWTNCGGTTSIDIM